MITDRELALYRTRLEDQLKELADADAARSADRAPVELDQQMVGRLSRMDALQQQSMAKATSARRKVEAVRVKAALKRLEEGEFGYCTDCGEEIAAGRLDQDPSVPRCVSCAIG